MSKKTLAAFHCNVCDVICSKISDWNRHLSTAKHKKSDFSDVFPTKNSRQHHCEKCNYTTLVKSDWNKHIITKKHLKNYAENAQIIKTYVCSNCNIEYTKYKSYWSHCKKCCDTSDELYTNVIQKLFMENQELRNIIIEQNIENKRENEELRNFVVEHSNNVINKIIENNQPITITNNKFNINVFLNEHCKDAMNLMDFVKNIQITNADIENNGQLGFVGGISKIFLDNLKQLSVYERPIHCTDIKRETMYIKSNDQWQKEEDKTKLQKAITEISRKSVAKINQWKTETPEYENMDSPEFTRGIIMSNNSMAGHNRELYADKIIRLLAKETMIDKQNLLL